MFSLRLRQCAVLSLAIAGLVSCDEEAPTEVDRPISSSPDQAYLLPTSGVSALAISLPVNQNVATTGTAPAFRVNQTGTGPNGIFQITRAASTRPALQGLTNGRGPAGGFEITNTNSQADALLARTNGVGNAVHAVASGNGSAGRFENTKPGSGSNALFAIANGRGMRSAR